MTSFQALLPLCAVALTLATPAPVVAQGKRKKQAKAKPSKRTVRRREARLKKVNKKLGVPIADLRRVEGWRFTSRRAADRQAMWKLIVKRPLAGLVPIVVEGALKERDLDSRYTAVKLLSVIGLEADRADYLERIHPLYPRLYADRYEQVWKDASRGATVLARWFEVDQEIAAFLTRVFDGKHYRLAQEALRGVIQLRHPDLRQSVGARAIREIVSPKTRFGVFERRLVIQANGARKGPITARALAEMMLADGTIAVAIANAVGRMGDPSVLPALRRIGRTSAHVLRIPVLQARGRLNDVELLALVEPTFADDHKNIRRALVEALGRLKHKAVPKVLRRLAKVVVGDKPLVNEVALAQLRHGEKDALAVLEPEVSGGAPDVRLADRVLGLGLPITTPLLQTMAATTAEGFGARRRRAIEELGVRRVEGVAAIASDLATTDPTTAKTGLRLSAAITLLQLKQPEARRRLKIALKDFNVVQRVNVRTKLGTARRYQGSVLSAAVARLVRSESTHAIPLLSRWLDPPRQGAKAKPTPDEKPKPKGGSAVRKPKKGETAKRVRALPPNLPSWLRHQFVRRDVTTALADLVRIAAARLKQDGVKQKATLERQRDRGLTALRRCLDDPRGVVRRAAIRGLATIAGRGPLPPGASLQTEADVEAEVRAWLETRGK